MTPLIHLMTIAVVPIAVLISMTHLVAAHQGPGDGFTAGIISALGLTLQYVTLGYLEARHRFRRVRFERLLVLGLAIALVASALPLLAGDPFLAIQEAAFDLPAVGTVALTRAMLFDVGIYFVVLGGAMTAIDSLWRVTQ